jgi:hypothetical protein
MSRSRIDWDKAKREQNAKKPAYRDDLGVFREEMPVPSQATVQGQRLKPILVEEFVSRKFSVEAKQYANKLIRSSRIKVLDRDDREDGICWVECEMQFRCRFINGIVHLLMSAFGARSVFRDGIWILQFTIHCQQSALDE